MSLRVVIDQAIHSIFYCVFNYSIVISSSLYSQIQPIQATRFNTMDIGLPASSPSGVNFMPSSPPPLANGMKCWPDDLNDKFMDMVCPQKKLLLLTPRRRSDYRFYLNNREATCQSNDKKERRAAANTKWWALKYFELQDNQVYRKPETDSDGTELKARYAACTYDACELIQKAHENLIHASKYLTCLSSYILI